MQLYANVIFYGFPFGWHERLNAPYTLFYDHVLQLFTTNFETNLCCWISCNIFYNHVVINKTINREFADDYHHQNICSSKDNYVEKPKHVKNDLLPSVRFSNWNFCLEVFMLVLRYISFLHLSNVSVTYLQPFKISTDYAKSLHMFGVN